MESPTKTRSTEDAEPGRAQRLFFALWPSDKVVQQLRSLQHALSVRGRRVSPDNFHITLAFIGNADLDYARCLRQAAAKVRAAPFTLQLDRLGYFKKPRIAWIGPSHSPEVFAALHSSLVDALTVCGFVAEARPFHPHVTLLRNAECQPVEPCVPLAWPVSDFVLVESKPTAAGVHYSVIQRYALSRNRE